MRPRAERSREVSSLTFSFSAALRRKRFDGNGSDDEIADRGQLHRRRCTRLEERREIDATVADARDQRAERGGFAGIEQYLYVASAFRRTCRFAADCSRT